MISLMSPPKLIAVTKLLPPTKLSSMESSPVIAQVDHGASCIQHLLKGQGWIQKGDSTIKSWWLVGFTLWL